MVLNLSVVVATNYMNGSLKRKYIQAMSIQRVTAKYLVHPC